MILFDMHMSDAQRLAKYYRSSHYSNTLATPTEPDAVRRPVSAVRIVPDPLLNIAFADVAHVQRSSTSINRPRSHSHACFSSSEDKHKGNNTRDGGLCVQKLLLVWRCDEIKGHRCLGQAQLRSILADRTSSSSQALPRRPTPPSNILATTT